jgi:hypothetical protein
LNGSRNGVQDNGKIQYPGLFEPVSCLFVDGGAIAFVEVFEFFEEAGDWARRAPFIKRVLGSNEITRCNTHSQ